MVGLYCERSFLRINVTNIFKVAFEIVNWPRALCILEEGKHLGSLWLAERDCIERTQRASTAEDAEGPERILRCCFQSCHCSVLKTPQLLSQYLNFLSVGNVKCDFNRQTVKHFLSTLQPPYAAACTDFANLCQL